MTNLPDRIRYIDPIDDFQVVCKRMIPTDAQVGTPFGVTSNEKALFINKDGHVAEKFSDNSKTIAPNIREVWVASLRKFQMVMGFGDTSGSPYSEAPSRIHAKDRSFQTDDGEEIRSATVSITCRVARDDRSSIDKLLEIKPEKFGVIYVKDVMREFNEGLSTSIRDKIASAKVSQGERSVKTDENRKRGISSDIRGAAREVLAEYGVVVENVQLNIVGTSRDTKHRLEELDKEAQAEHEAKIERIKREIEKDGETIASLKLILNKTTLEGEVSLSKERLQTKILEQKAKQAEYITLTAKFAREAQSLSSENGHGSETRRAFRHDPKQLPHLHKLILDDARATDILAEIKATGGVNLRERDGSGRTALLFSIANRRRTAVGVLLGQGADIRAVDSSGRNMLHTIAEQNQSDLMHILYEHEGVDNAALGNMLASKDAAKETPFDIAMRENHTQVAGEIIRLYPSSLEIKGGDGKKPMDIIIEKKDLQLATLAIEKTGTNKTSELSDNLLHKIVQLNNVGLFRKLLHHFKAINIKDVDSDGRTIVHVSVLVGGYDLLGEILAKYGDELQIDAIDSKDRTALHYAAEKGYWKIVDLLLKKGASVNIRDAADRTALDLAKIMS